MRYVIVDCSDKEHVNVFPGDISDIGSIINNGTFVYVIEPKGSLARNRYISRFRHNILQDVIKLKCQTKESLIYLSSENKEQRQSGVIPETLLKEYIRNLCYGVGLLDRLEDLRREVVMHNVYASQFGNREIGIPASIINGIYNIYGGFRGIPKWLQECTNDKFENNTMNISEENMSLFIDRLKSVGILDSLFNNIFLNDELMR